MISGASRATGASARRRVGEGSQAWVRAGSEHPWHRGGRGKAGTYTASHRNLGLALAALRQGTEHPLALAVRASSTHGCCLPQKGLTWFLPNFPAAVAGVALPGRRAGTGTMAWCHRPPAPALRPALPPAAWGGWRGRGMAAICRARLNNRPPRKISRPPPRPSIVFGTRCCFFRLLSYFSLTFFPDLRHMPSPCPAALN